MEKKTIKILIPDTGPLITLEKINRLDLLTLPNLQIEVVDAVYIELVNPSHNNEAINRFFIDNINVKQRMTETGIIMQLQDWRNLPRSQKSKHNGENAIMDLLTVISEKNPNLISEYLVLSEDTNAIMMFNKFSKNFLEKPICIDTISFIYALEKSGYIKEAKEIIKEIKSIGRYVNDDTINKNFTL